MAAMEIRFVHRTCSGGSRKFLFRGEPLLTPHPSLPLSPEIPLICFLCCPQNPQNLSQSFQLSGDRVYKNRTSYQDAKCAKGKGEWGGDISPLVHQEIMRSIPTTQCGDPEKENTSAHFAPKKTLLVNKISLNVVKCRVVQLLK